MTTQAPDLNSPAAARAGIAAGVLAYIIWGLMPIYWRLLGKRRRLRFSASELSGVSSLSSGTLRQRPAR